jgi:hypothetical protein
MQKCRADNRKQAKAIPQDQLDDLLEEATIDCYNESEQVSGFFCMIEEHLAIPFTTKLLGQEVSVEELDVTEADEIVAICRRGPKRLRISILDLPLPNPRPVGAEWIEAYRYWARMKQGKLE